MPLGSSAGRLLATRGQTGGLPCWRHGFSSRIIPPPKGFARQKSSSLDPAPQGRLVRASPTVSRRGHRLGRKEKGERANGLAPAICFPPSPLSSPLSTAAPRSKRRCSLVVRASSPGVLIGLPVFLPPDRIPPMWQLPLRAGVPPFRFSVLGPRCDSSGSS